MAAQREAAHGASRSMAAFSTTSSSKALKPLGIAAWFLTTWVE